MPDTLFYLAIFFIIALVCALEPGPNFVLLARNTVARGRCHGFLTALGIHLRAYPAIILAATGMAALAAAIPSALYFIKIAGAAYLIWMGIRSFRDNPVPADAEPAGTSRSTAGRSFANGFVQVLLNPPTYAFYASLPVIFVLVVDASPVAGVGTQIAVFGVATNLVFLAVDLVFVATLDRFSSRVSQKPAVRRAIQWLTETALVALGVRLATRGD